MIFTVCFTTLTQVCFSEPTESNTLTHAILNKANEAIAQNMNSTTVKKGLRVI